MTDSSRSRRFSWLTAVGRFCKQFTQWPCFYNRDDQPSLNGPDGVEKGAQGWRHMAMAGVIEAQAGRRWGPLFQDDFQSAA
jgi:hypothetical protein